MKAYLFGSIFYEKDIEYNKELLIGIRKAWPGIDIYAPQEAPFNDKKSFGDSKAIYEGDYNRLKETDLLIGCLDGDCPPIGSTAESGIFSEMAKQDPNKKMIVLHTDTRDGYKTASQAKFDSMSENQCASQFNYFNLFLTGVIESCGTIVGTKEQLFEYVKQLYDEYRKNNHFSGIYLITNRVNNKQYIGQSVDIPKRLNSHRWPKTDTPQVIDLAIQKYGIENFTFEVLEQCEESVLDEREKYWSEEVYGCSTFSPNGYNIATCGNSNHGTHPIAISCYSKDGKKIKSFSSILQAAVSYKCNPRAISQALDVRNRTSLGVYWASGVNDNIEVEEVNKHHGDTKQNDVYDLSLKLITTFDTLTDTADFLDVSLSAVDASYNTPGRRVRSKYYIVPHGEDPKVLLYGYPKKIYCYDKQTREFVKEYETSAVAAKELECDASTILKCAKGKYYYAYGYIWSYMNYNKLPADYKNMNKEYWEGVKEMTVEHEFDDEEETGGDCRNDR